MKRCPTCNRVETDKSLRFCRVDGATLVIDSSAIEGEAGTVYLGSPADASEVHTNILPHRTDSNFNRATAPTTVLPPRDSTPATQQLFGGRKVSIGIVVFIVLVGVAVGGYFAAGRFIASKKEKAIESVAVLPFENKSGSADSE